MKNVILCWAVLVGASCASIQAGTYVHFHTVVGDLEVELYDKEKPATVRNFLNYVRSGAYTNMFLHRCLPKFFLCSCGSSDRE
jgi:peptidyl-prolyl cis-trans isomerase A (cyclophilin A)